MLAIAGNAPKAGSGQWHHCDPEGDAGASCKAAFEEARSRAGSSQVTRRFFG
jgi:hypothetical protein